MPYIPQKERYYYEWCNKDRLPENSGQLNFVITQICKAYFDRNGGRYAQINDIIGVLECAKLEFNRRIVAKYEDAAIVRNGDCY